MAATPHLFGQRPPERTLPFLCIPSVVSEKRFYFTAAWLPADTIVSNAAFTAADPDGLLFALISSSMFMVWQRTVGGRLKSDLRFSNTIVWNNFPLPESSLQKRSSIIEAGKDVLEARFNHPSLSLAQMYEPSSMPSDLFNAHVALDEAVDGAFGLNGRDVAEEERQSVLFHAYARLDARLPSVRVEARGRRG